MEKELYFLCPLCGALTKKMNEVYPVIEIAELEIEGDNVADINVLDVSHKYPMTRDWIYAECPVCGDAIYDYPAEALTVYKWEEKGKESRIIYLEPNGEYWQSEEHYSELIDLGKCIEKQLIAQGEKVQVKIGGKGIENPKNISMP